MKGVGMVFAVMALLWFPAIVSGLRCYVCSSATHQNCGKDDFLSVNANITECGEEQSCYKTEILGIIARHCGEYADNGCIDFLIQTCYCSTDLCNDAISPLLSLVLALFGFVGTRLL